MLISKGFKKLASHTGKVTSRYYLKKLSYRYGFFVLLVGYKSCLPTDNDIPAKVSAMGKLERPVDIYVWLHSLKGHRSVNSFFAGEGHYSSGSICACYRDGQ